MGEDRAQYGWRAKIGLIYIASSWVMEPEFYAMAPDGVSIHTTRISLGPVTVDNLSRVGDKAVEAVKLLAEIPLDAILLGCTSGSFIGGATYDQELTSRMSAAAGGIPCVTTATAVKEGLRALGVKNVALATPYPEVVHRYAEGFLTGNGFTVVSNRFLGLESDTDNNRLSLEEVFALGRAVDTPAADCVFISCTGLRSLGIIQALEISLGKAVVTANQASYWLSLRAAGVREPIPGYGKLLEL